MSTQHQINEFYRNALDYDFEYQHIRADIPWLVQLCQTYGYGDKILDLCCGTLRETIPIANEVAPESTSITGVDISPDMLERGRNKLLQEPIETQAVIQLVQGDIRDVSLESTDYRFAFVPFSSFLHMLTQNDQVTALANIYRHLAPGAHFIADIFCPDVTRLSQNKGPEWIRSEIQNEDLVRNEFLVRTSTTRYHQRTQTLDVTFFYQVYSLTGERHLLRSYWSPLTMRLIFPAEWRLLLERVGFKIIEEWSDYSFNHFYDSKLDTAGKMLFLCRKD